MASSSSTASSSAWSAARSATCSSPATRSARVGLWTAVTAYAAGFSALSVLRYRGFVDGRFDLGNMVQAVWSTAHGHVLEITNVQGDQFVRLGAHVDPILIAFAPLWWLVPTPSLLLVTQALAVALGALPVYWLARKHLASERAALGFALAYLLYPAVEWLTLNEFHPVALACPLLLFAFWALDEDRIWAFAAFAALAALTKEDVGLVVAGFGLWYVLARRRAVAGFVVAGVAAAWSLFALAVVIPHFNSGEASSFYSRYGEVGGSPTGVLSTALTRPGHLLATAFGVRSLEYLAQLALPLALLFVAAPLALLAAAPELAINMLSATPTQTSIHFHYTAALIPPFVVASVLGAGRLARRWPDRTAQLGTVAAAAALAANYVLGPIPFWRELPGGSTFGANDARVTAHDRITARALRLVPANAVVSATNSLGAHLSARTRILSFPVIADAAWVAVDETQPGYADRIAPLPTAVQVVWLRRNPAWRLVFQRDGVLVFHRVLPP